MGNNYAKPYNGEKFKAWSCADPQTEYIKEIGGRAKSISPFRKPLDGTMFAVTWFRVMYDRGENIKCDKWRMSVEEYDNGLVGFSECDTIATLEKAKEFVKMKKKVSNNWYACFGIMKVTIKGETATCEIVMKTETDGCVGVITKNRVVATYGY
jgi:hypothetical protein